MCIVGILLGGHVRAVFTLITIIFVVCVTLTLTSFKEIPLQLLESHQLENLHTNGPGYGSLSPAPTDGNNEVLLPFPYQFQFRLKSCRWGNKTNLRLSYVSLFLLNN